MLTKIADRLIRLAESGKLKPFEHIEGYMNRYWLIPYGRWRFLPAVRLHHILRSDNDRHFHDHPWDFISIILRGGYKEVRPMYDRSGLYRGNSVTPYPPGSILFRKAKDYHQLLVPAGGTCWTMFISFRYRQKWGFLVHHAPKMRYETYQGKPIRENHKEVIAKVGES